MLMPARRQPGGRGRIGVIQPAPGVMLEHEWPAWLPPDMLFPIGRVRLMAPTAEGYAAVSEAAPAIARDLATAGCGVIAFACTVGALFAGAAAEAELIARLKAASGRPAISLAATSMAALAAVGGTRLAVMTPYDAATNRWVGDYAEAHGMTVVDFVATPVGIVEVGSLQPAEIAALAIAGLARLPDADALWIPCTAIQTMPAIAAIEAVTGRPVVSGTQALLWHALQVLGVSDPIQSAGHLFQQRLEE